MSVGDGVHVTSEHYGTLFARDFSMPSESAILAVDEACSETPWGWWRKRGWQLQRLIPFILAVQGRFPQVLCRSWVAANCLQEWGQKSRICISGGCCGSRGKMKSDVLKLGERITCLPVIHGSGEFALAVRRVMLEREVRLSWRCRCRRRFRRMSSGRLSSCRADDGRRRRSSRGLSRSGRRSGMRTIRMIATSHWTDRRRYEDAG